jgi:hypothetical protein
VCIERIRERLANRREFFRALVLIVLAIASGVILNLYQILAHKVPFYTIIFSVVGLGVGLRFVWYLGKIVKELDELEEEIECLASKS